MIKKTFDTALNGVLARTGKHGNMLSYELNAGQERALKVLQSGANCFVTGSAGTGKSFLLRRFIDGSKSVLVTAPTGIAAVRLGGRTIHSAFRYGKFGRSLGIITPRECEFSDDTWFNLVSGRKYELIHACDTLVIDEISMARADIFKWVANFLRAERERTGHHIQLVCCGDFFQLPPIINDKDAEVWRRVYPDNPQGFAFLSQEWKELDIKTIELKQIVRQKDRDFAQALNSIRLGDPDGSGRRWILEHSAREFVPGGVEICAHRKDARAKNERNLERLDAPLVKIPTVFEGDGAGRIDERFMAVDKVLKLKAGARVMTVVNDPYGRFQNGSLGTVREVIFDDVSNDYLFVRVTLDSGLDVDIPRYAWEVNEPECVGSGGDARVRYTHVSGYCQFPLRLAWACTIHKSQGATYSSANISTGNIWESGQLYVALSRASEAGRMYVDGALSSPESVMQNEAVTRFYEAEQAKAAAWEAQYFGIKNSGMEN